MKNQKKSSSTTPALKGESPSRKRILVVDDHPMTRAGVVQFLNRQPDLEVSGEAGDPASALAEISRCRPDLILADITMPGRSGAEFIKDVLAIYEGMPILVVSMHDESIYAERMLRAGARGYIMKEAGGENLLAAVRRVLAGQVYLSDKMSAQVLENISGRSPRGSSSPIRQLSDREFEVFQLIGQGKSTAEIARQLKLSSKTVDVHRAHIKEKLELADVNSLIRFAVRWMESQRENPQS